MIFMGVTLEMKKELTVLHIISDFDGGISSFVRNKAEALKNSNIRFNVVTFNEPDEKMIKLINALDGEIYKVPNPKKESFKKFFKAINEVYSKQPDIFTIHSHIQGYRMLPFYLASKKFKVNKFIVHAHTDAKESTKRSIENKVNRLINQKVNVKYASCGQKATENLFGNIHKPVMIIPNSIAPDNFITSLNSSERDRGRANEFGIDQDTLLIGNIGRFHDQKNHEFMIDVIEDMKNKSIKFLWIFIGEGELFVKIKNLTKKRNLDGYVQFLGRRSDVPYLLKLMDYFALPSHYEGLPTVAVEAQASGTPTIMSDKITKESDLGLGLVNFLPIDDVEYWSSFFSKDKIERLEDTAKIKNKLSEKNFTNIKSAALYVAYLRDIVEEYSI